MTDKTEQLNELIEITRDGQRFYQHAHDEVKDVRLQVLFRDMSQSKSELIRALSVVTPHGKFRSRLLTTFVEFAMLRMKEMAAAR